jgi:hypothetical protein
MPFKVYVDSRFRQDTGGSNTNCEFTVELPHPIQVRGRAYIDVILVPNTFYVVRAGENDRLHLRENASTYRIAVVAEGQYNAITLKDALLVALNTGKSMTGNYTASFDSLSNKYTIGNLDDTATFHVYPTKWLKANASTWNSFASATAVPQISGATLMDIGSVLGFNSWEILSGNDTVAIVAPDVVNLLPYHQLFLRSSIGTGYDAIGPDGSSDIIRRITCQVPLNSIIVDQHSQPHDSVNVGNREVTSMSFRLTDVYGKTVNTNGHHISFSVIFLEDE